MLSIKALQVFILLSVLTLTFRPALSSEAFNWQQVPLRTSTQAKHNLPGGEGFQKIMALEFSRSEPGIVYMATDQSQVWKSLNAGKSWERFNKGFYAHGARSIGVDPKNSNVVIAAGFVGKNYKKGRTLTDKHQGIYLTTDGGNNWSFKKETDFFKQASKGRLIAYIPEQKKTGRSSKIVVGSYSEGLLFSEDSGESWRAPGLLVKEKILDIEADEHNPGRLLIATEQGLYSVINNTADKIGDGLPSYPRNVAFNNNVAGMVYAAVGNDGIYISRDGAKSFTESRKGLPLSTGLPYGTDFTEIEASLVNGNIVYAKAHTSRNKNVYYSHDAGKTWQVAKDMNKGKLMPTHPGGYFSGSIAASPRDENVALFAANSQDNILSTHDAGNSWSYSGSGFSGGRMKDIEFVSDKRMVFALTDFGLWESNDSGNTFKQLPTGRLFGLMSSESLAINDKHIIASLGQWHKMGLAISDDGSHWRHLSTNPGRYNILDARENIVYAGNLVSNDFGRNWKTVKHEIRAVHPTDKDIVYGIHEGADRKITVMKSSDQGSSWNSITTPVPLTKKSVRGMAVSTADKEKIFMATTRGIYKYADNKWSLINHKQGLEKDHFGMTAVYCLAVDPDKQNRLFAGRWAPGIGRSNGIFMSEDGGDSWKNISDNLMDALTVWAIKIDSKNSHVYIGTSHGTFRASYAQETEKDANN